MFFSPEKWTLRLRNAIARPHITLGFLIVAFLLILDTVVSVSKGDWNWYMDYWWNWYVQEVWYIVSTPSIWWDALQFYVKMFGMALLAIIIPLVVFILLGYQLGWKTVFPRWYMNGYEEGTIYAKIHPAGFWYSAYIFGAKMIYKVAGKIFEPPKKDKIEFLFSPNWKTTMRAFFNPLGALKHYQGSEKFKQVGRTSSAAYFQGYPSMVATNMLRRSYTDKETMQVEYAKSEIDLKGILRTTQSTCGKAIGDALYSNSNVHKKVLDDQGFIIPEPAKEGIIATLLRRRHARQP